jgi:guanidinoacetate N-methyltransferase
MDGTEELIFTDNYITLANNGDSHTIMHVGETLYMEKLAELVTKNGGHILEIGFGMHISADFIQSNPNVKSHTIIEVHPEIYNKGLEWAKDKPNVELILGDWIDILPLKNKLFDGVFYDPYNDYNLLKFLDYVKDNCKKETIVGFYDHPAFDERLNGLQVTILETDLNSIPFRHITEFKGNRYELKYTIFDGVNFHKGIKNNKLI